MGTMMAPRAHARSGPEQPVDWSSPVGARIRVTSTRMVSLTQRAIAAISYTVEPVENGLRLVVQSDLVANEELPQIGKDPRLSAILQSAGARPRSRRAVPPTAGP